MRKSQFKIRFQCQEKKSKPQTGLTRRWAELNQNFVTVLDQDLFV